MRRLFMVTMLVLAGASTASAQMVDPPRRVVFADVGYARTMDDEGYLGSGAALRVGAGYRLSRRWTIQGIVERIPYHRDVEWLRFDGRMLFGGVEAAFLAAKPKVRPYFTVGTGIGDDDGVWIDKRSIHPRLPRVEERRERHYRVTMVTTSGGIDVKVSERTSIQAGLRYHGLLDAGPGGDLAPLMILQPTIGAAFRW
jgi:hypothetical protein